MSADSDTNIQPIFITGRFRSGTSFLWQLFNQMENCCAWYEPLHPQLLSAIEHTKPKEDHVGIEDYWQTYRLNTEFATAYDMRFATERLYLEADDEYPELAAYINHLIELSHPHIPVLQFNRMDFRLPWLKANFPSAKIIHIERNPLQLYHSQRKHIDPAHFHHAHYWDAYELMPWCYALKQQFAFLLDDESDHAFFPFYGIYRLSKLIASSCCDVSINLDTQVFQSQEFIDQLSAVIALSSAQKEQIKNLTNVPELQIFDDQISDELVRIMTAVDLKLSQSGLLERLGKEPLAKIKTRHRDFWDGYEDTPNGNNKLLLNINQLNSELTRILAENRQLKDEIMRLETTQHAEQASDKDKGLDE